MSALKNYRKEAGFKTQKALAEHMGVQRGAVAKWEVGLSQPTIEAIPILAKALNVSTDEVIEAVSKDNGKEKP
jgi:transcriptional regulator with XRE-family HTH domain